ncbi:MAG: TetR/AcrR family transcriptional regulator [Solirubrobacterales bacterium]
MPTTASNQTRGDRRREQTRARLLAAARELFAEKGVGATRLGEITERADVAAGSLYNHFADKDEIVDTLLHDISEEQGSLVDELTADIDDPAAVVAFAQRHFVRLALADPSFGALAIRLDASHRLMQQTLGPRAVRDIQAGIDAGRFAVSDPVVALQFTGGALIGTIAGIVDGLAPADVDELHAEAVLRSLGLTGAQAAKVARLPMG